MRLSLLIVAHLVCVACSVPSHGYHTLDRTGCSRFFDLEFNRFNFDRYHTYFDENSTLTFPAAGKYTGVDGIMEYVKFASGESPYIDSTLRLRGAMPYFKWKNAAGECVFTAMGQSVYVLNPTYSSRESWRITSLLSVTYDPKAHRIRDILLYYDSRMVQDLFSKFFTHATAQFICETMQHTCAAAGVDVWRRNGFAHTQECISRFMALDLFDDGAWLADSPGGGIDGNSAGCRMLHATLASQNPTMHCAHLSLVPMADPLGRIKCSTSSRINATDLFDEADMENFHNFKTVIGVDEALGYEVVDECRPPAPAFARPFWDRLAGHNTYDAAGLPLLERMHDEAFAWFTTASLFVSVVILGLGLEWVVGTHLIEVLHVDTMRLFWKTAELTFPLFVTLGLVSSSYFALILLSLGLWKLGTPETVTSITLATSPDVRLGVRVRGAMDGLGLLLHHCLTAWLCVCIVTHRESLDRNVLSCTLPLVMQHWLAVIRKQVPSHLGYLAVQLVIEALWEWNVIWQLIHYRCLSANLQVTAIGMLSSHWLFMASQVLGMFGIGTIKQTTAEASADIASKMYLATSLRADRRSLSNAESRSVSLSLRLSKSVQKLRSRFRRGKQADTTANDATDRGVVGARDVTIMRANTTDIFAVSNSDAPPGPQVLFRRGRLERLVVLTQDDVSSNSPPWDSLSTPRSTTPRVRWPVERAAQQADDGASSQRGAAGSEQGGVALSPGATSEDPTPIHGVDGYSLTSNSTYA